MVHDKFEDIKYNAWFLARFAPIVIILAVLLISSAVGSFNDKEYVVTVTDRVVKYDGHRKSKYLIFCEDIDGNPIVFENTDCWVRGKANSSDMYERLKVGKTFTVTAVGWRIPILNRYQNIIKAREH